MKNHNHNDKLGPRLTAARDGLRAHLPKGLHSIKVGDKTYAIADLDQLFAGYEGKFLAADDGHAALTRLVHERDVVAPPSRELLADFKTAMMHVLGRRNPLLLKFGLKPEKDARRSRAGKTDPTAPTTPPATKTAP